MPGISEMVINSLFAQNFAAVSRLLSLIKVVFEKLSICRRSEWNSIEPRTEGIRGTIREFNAKIHSGDYSSS
jgi:hypothetical protein